MKEKSLNINLILNSIKTGMSIIFPLITFPYITKVLSSTAVGIYNYTNSLVNYFVLFAGLGINTYAVCNGAKLRNEREDFSEFASEIFTLNICSMLSSYVVLIACLICFETFSKNRLPIALFSISILFQTIGVEWVFNIFEEYKYITIRSIIFQIFSIVMLFTFVKQENDLYAYILINVFSNVGANLFNFFRARKYCCLKIVFKKRIFKHLKSVILIFSTTLATMIYVNSDMTMLGILCDTKQVGYYTVASKMYNCIKAVLNSMVIVFMSRLTYQYKAQKEEYRKTFRYAADIITLITIPLAVGSFFYSKVIILMLSNAEYLPAENAMKFLFVSLIFATLANLYGAGGLLLAGKEKVMLKITGTGAVLNILINLFLIPRYGTSGAALATLITEVFIYIVFLYFYNVNIGVKIGNVHILKCILATGLFGMVYKSVVSIGDTIIYQMIGILVCILSYILVLIILKDSIMLELWNMAKKRIEK